MATITHNLFWGAGEGDFRLNVTKGRWPTDADGAVFIVGPDKRRPGGHWFNEHGMICKIHCAPDSGGRVRVQFRLVETPVKKLRDRLPWLFRKVFVMEASPFGVTNLANTNVQPMNDRLFLGYDVGRPVEIDPETLDYVTAVGDNTEWVHSLPGLIEPMTSVAAHPAPAYDENALYFVNYLQIPLPGIETGTWVARWALDGPVERWKLDGIGKFDSIHDIKATKDYLVITDLPFATEPAVVMGGPRKRPNQDFTRLWIVSKKDLRQTPAGGSVPFRELKIPMSTGHIAVDYDNPGGEITVYLQHIGTADLAITCNPNERNRDGQMFDPNHDGLIALDSQPSVVGRYRIAAGTGELKETKLAYDRDQFWGGILWTQNVYTDSSQRKARNLFYGSMGFDPELMAETTWRLYKDYQHAIVPMDRLPEKYIPGALARVDLEQMEYSDVYRYGDGMFPHPPTFVPRRNCQHDLDGYVVVVVHKKAPKEIHIFDAANLAQGPVAVASAPDFNPPFMLHSCWMAPRKGPRPSQYRVDPVKEVWGAVRDVPGRVSAFARMAGLMVRKPKRAERSA